MVSVAVSTLGRTDLFFVDPGTKVNGQYYRDILLRQQLLPAIRGLSGDFFTFQQDDAPAHRARETVHLLTHETPDFITPALWPANSPDLNPVDYQIWGKLQEHVYRSQIRDVDQLKSRLIEEGNISTTRSSSMKRSGSGDHVFELAFEHTVDILNADFRCADVLPFARTHT